MFSRFIEERVLRGIDPGVVGSGGGFLGNKKIFLGPKVGLRPKIFEFLK